MQIDENQSDDKVIKMEHIARTGGNNYNVGTKKFNKAVTFT